MRIEDKKEVDNILEIDKTRLDDECERQPYLVWEYGKKLAKAILLADEAAAKLKLAEADVDEAIRERPTKFGLEKITEAGVKRAILRSELYQKALKEYNNAKYSVALHEAAVKSLEHRRTSLTMLDGQDARGYYSRPHQKERSDTGVALHRKVLKKRKKVKRDN